MPRCLALAAQLPGKVASGHGGRRLVWPGGLGRLIGNASGGGSSGCFKVMGGLQKTEWFCGGRHPVRGKNGYGPVVRPTPGIAEHLQINGLALAGIGMEYQVSLPGVIADDNRKVPLGPPAKPQVLHHQHRVARGNLAKHTFKLFLQRINQHTVGPGGGHHFDLQRSLAAGYINEFFQDFRIGLQSLAVEHHGQ